MMELRRQLASIGAVGLVAMMASACSSNDGVNPLEPRNFAIEASLGALKGAICDLRAYPDGPVIQSVGTDNSGRAVFANVTARPPLLVECRGSATATYFDEFTGLNEPFPAGSSLRTLISSSGYSAATGGGLAVGVSALTELAFQAVDRTNPASARDELIPQALDQVALLLGIPNANYPTNQAVQQPLIDFAAPPRVLNNTPLQRIEGLMGPDLYAAMLGGLAYAAAARGETTVDFIVRLAGLVRNNQPVADIDLDAIDQGILDFVTNTGPNSPELVAGDINDPQSVKDRLQRLMQQRVGTANGDREARRNVNITLPVNVTPTGLTGSTGTGGGGTQVGGG